MALTDHKCPHCAAQIPDFVIDEITVALGTAFLDRTAQHVLFMGECPECRIEFGFFCPQRGAPFEIVARPRMLIEEHTNIDLPPKDVN